ncbi:MAG: hypothetical protein J6I68_14595 [Butyrivibrio sp.]|uniref:hypothetical protein n=1 Tax=Butyrivibrio sp. TaxID=28121 RepID=UPI001B719C27|nr:hypothetical protein [Butyrivibrio sp.]MBP3784471.1 hypothetical protein [Butyrivibrio sp.]
MLSYEDKNVKLITFLGMERCDVVYYSAAVFASAGKDVLVVDNSCSHDFFRSIPKPEREPYAKVGNITCVADRKMSYDFFYEFDIVICYNGRSKGKDATEIMNKSDIIYVQTSYSPYQAEDISKLLSDDIEGDYEIIYRDKPSGKVSEKIIIDELGFIPEAVKESYIFSYDMQDYSCYINFVRNGHQKLSPLSGDIKAFLMTLYEEFMPEIDKKEAKRLFSRALSGKIE